ncbi:MAG: hypothetical protein JJU29_09525 [Verrucomicrobia bacterium]|nr:hypothetical protein [Verrucomicrobiota bacterium]
MRGESTEAGQSETSVVSEDDEATAHEENNENAEGNEAVGGGAIAPSIPDAEPETRAAPEFTELEELLFVPAGELEEEQVETLRESQAQLQAEYRETTERLVLARQQAAMQRTGSEAYRESADEFEELRGAAREQIRKRLQIERQLDLYEKHNTPSQSR